MKEKLIAYIFLYRSKLGNRINITVDYMTRGHWRHRAMINYLPSSNSYQRMNENHITNILHS